MTYYELAVFADYKRRPKLVIDPFKVTHIWLIAVAIAPALLATILVFLDQQITAVIVEQEGT